MQIVRGSQTEIANEWLSIVHTYLGTESSAQTTTNLSIDAKHVSLARAV